MRLTQEKNKEKDNSEIRKSMKKELDKKIKKQIESKNIICPVLKQIAWNLKNH